jgi:hypothetical protein
VARSIAGDHVCVLPETRAQAATDNRLAASRVDPHIFERLRVLAGFKFAQTPERGGPDRIAGDIDVVRQGVPSRGVGVGPILQRTQEPPPVRPFWVELHRVAVELDCAGKVALFPGGCGTLS